MQIATTSAPLARWRVHFQRRHFLAAGLASLVLVVFFPVRNHDFINYDDNAYIYANPYVAAGFSMAGIKRAFLQLYTNETYWHPVTWVSHMLDAQLFGVDPGWHHLVSVWFHALNVILLFLGLNRLTGKLWPSLLAAGLFAVHPLQLDTVAWAAERKNLLHTLFGFLTIGAYAQYVRTGRKGWYAGALGLFATGLMCKPALVTLPCALLLLDYWPLGRLAGAFPGTDSVPLASGRERWLKVRALVLEKLPFLGLSLISAVITIYAHQEIEGAESPYPMGFRLRNAVVAYARYFRRVFWPADLAVFYPYDLNLGWVLLVISLLILLSVTGAVMWFGRHRPYLIVGWLWFLGNLVPAIGVVQAGAQAMADRFSYFPLVGLFTAMAFWILLDLGGREEVGTGRKIVAALAVGACLCATWVQLPRWKNTETVFSHALRVTQRNWVALGSLGGYYFNTGKFLESARHFEAAVRIRPDDENVRFYALSLDRLGMTTNAVAILKDYLRAALRPAAIHLIIGELVEGIGDKATAGWHYRKAVELAPQNVEARATLAGFHAEANELEVARQHYHWVLGKDPFNWQACIGMAKISLSDGRPDVALAFLEKSPTGRYFSAERLYNLGVVYARMGKVTEAEEAYLRSLEKRPDYYDANYNLGNLYARAGKFAEATNCFSRAITKRPNSDEAHSNLALSLASLGDLAGAAAEYRAALKISPQLADVHYGLARVLELQTNLVEAATHYSRALAVRTNLHDARLGLAMVLNQQQKWGEAAGQLEVFLKANPGSGLGHYQLAIAQLKLGRVAEAITHLERAVELRPRDRGAADQLARVLATATDGALRNGKRAVGLAEAVCSPRETALPEHLGTLAAAYAEAGGFEQAVAVVTQAIKGAEAGNRTGLARELAAQLQLYRERKPLRGGF